MTHHFLCPCSNLHLDTLDGELLLQDGGHHEQLLGEEGEGEALGLSDLPSGFSVFDALRDTIYSEVATLIANNESRPHFLVELFRELQMLTTDYLRQRALYNLQDLVTRYLTEEGVAQEAKAIAASANLVCICMYMLAYIDGHPGHSIPEPGRNGCYGTSV